MEDSEVTPHFNEAIKSEYEPSRPSGLRDQGIWPENDNRAWLALMPGLSTEKTTIVVGKAKRVLTLLHDGVPVISYPIALGFDPNGDKQQQGDGKTPEGKYYICETLEKNLAPRYGARSMRISYPNKKDAARGVNSGLISPSQQKAIAKAIEAQNIPPQNTKLGSSIRIHGGGVGQDWTLGCIAMRDPDVIDLYSVTKIGTEVKVLGDQTPLPYGDLDRDGIPNQVDFLLGGKKTVLNGATYDGKYVKIPPTNGDVPQNIGVCTDVIVRALRNAGLDLQSALQQDIKKRPNAYPKIKSRDPSIDHRRVKNLVPWFQKHWQALPLDDLSTFMPGDVIFMDTLPAKGPDHIGIISDRLGDSGRPLVINNWTYGYQTSEMDLLGFVPVLGHFRWK